jgi:hypothetical protein
MSYQYGIWYIDMEMHHIDMVILDIDMGYGLMIWHMTVSILSSWISIWDILSHWSSGVSWHHAPHQVIALAEINLETQL